MGLFLYQGGQHFGKAEGNIGNYWLGLRLNFGCTNLVPILVGILIYKIGTRLVVTASPKIAGTCT
jgi:hypothetical protein